MSLFCGNELTILTSPQQKAFSFVNNMQTINLEVEEDNNFPRERVGGGKSEDGRVFRVSLEPIRISFYRFKNCTLFQQFSWTEIYEVNEVGANEAPALIRSPIVTFLVRVEHRTVWNILSFIIILLVLGRTTLSIYSVHSILTVYVLKGKITIGQ